MTESRVKKSLLNAKVDLFFYVLTWGITFFSRKVFLDCLGTEFLGLTSTMENLLGFFNLAELGIGAAIGYVLYKPLYECDQTRINEIITVLGYLYRRIGIFILIIGILLSLFLPLIFPNTGFHLFLIYCVYYVFLTSSLIGYFINYRQNLLGADQRNYVVSGYFKSCNVLKTLTQVSLAYYTGNYYIWIGVELGFGILYSFILNWKINKVYPWLKPELKQGRAILNKYQDVTRYAKQLYIQKVGFIVQWQVAPFLTYVFSSLNIVALYGNYTSVAGKASQAFLAAMDGTIAGIGNLIAEGNVEKIKKVFWELLSIRYYMGGILVFCIYMLMQPFIILWLGEQYLLSKTVLLLLAIDVFISSTRGCISQFLYGYGLFSDVWVHIAGAILNMILSCVLGYLWGLAGVLLGCIIVPFLIYNVWKPYFLYKQAFKIALSNYIWQWCFICVLISVSMGTVYHILELFSLPDPSESFFKWGIYAVIVFTVYSLFSFILMYVSLSSFRLFVSRFVRVKIPYFKITLH